MARIAALVVAAGRGSRAGGDRPKQYAALHGKPVLGRTLDALAASGIERICVVIGAEDRELFDAVAIPPAVEMLIAEGGPTRQESVRNGLEALAVDPLDLVLIHDGARPFVSDLLVGRLAAAAGNGVGAVPGLAVSDSLKRVEGERIVGPVAREGLCAVQTPQAFPFPRILEAHRHAASIGQNDLTDDAAVAALAGLEVRIVEGDPDNIKITVPADFARAETILERRMETRTGQGYDVHAFGPGKSVWLCGVEVPHELGLTGHSDADVGLHSLTDAVLGAIGDGDIGMHFPPSDPKWKGASSDRFLADALRRVTERGGRIVHLDVTMVCEAPKVGPHRDRMRETIARIAGIEVDRVGVKATTSEGLGFTGRREGIAAMAIATVKLPVAP